LMKAIYDWILYGSADRMEFDYHAELLKNQDYVMSNEIRLEFTKL
jgi:hypothetical protein